MSLDLVVLTAGSARDFDHALRVASGDDAGAADEERIDRFAGELDGTFDDRHWPFTGDPIVTPSHVSLVIAHQAWEDVVPAIVRSAHRHGLVVLDPQWEKLFPPGTDYDVDDVDDRAERPSERLRLEVTVHRPDGTSDDLGVVYDSSPLGRWSPRRVVARLRFRRAAR